MTNFVRTIPLLVCADIGASHDFLVEAFGFEPGGVDVDGDGEAVHGEVRIGDTVVWLHRVSPEFSLSSPRTMETTSGGLVVHVPDVDAHCERGRAAGCDDRLVARGPGVRATGVRRSRPRRSPLLVRHAGAARQGRLLRIVTPFHRRASANSATCAADGRTDPRAADLGEGRGTARRARRGRGRRVRAGLEQRRRCRRQRPRRRSAGACRVEHHHEHDHVVDDDEHDDHDDASAAARGDGPACSASAPAVHLGAAGLRASTGAGARDRAAARRTGTTAPAAARAVGARGHVFDRDRRRGGLGRERGRRDRGADLRRSAAGRPRASSSSRSTRAGASRSCSRTPEALPGYAPGVCESMWSCQAGRYVVLNDDRWSQGSPAWPGPLDAYRQMVLNHETGHWLGLGARVLPRCGCAGAGDAAAVEGHAGLRDQLVAAAVGARPRPRVSAVSEDGTQASARRGAASRARQPSTSRASRMAALEVGARAPSSSTARPSSP